MLAGEQVCRLIPSLLSVQLGCLGGPVALPTAVTSAKSLDNWTLWQLVGNKKITCWV